MGGGWGGGGGGGIVCVKGLLMDCLFFVFLFLFLVVPPPSPSWYSAWLAEWLRRPVWRAEDPGV